MEKETVANGVVLDPRQEMALDLYKNPESATFGNMRQSLLKAGYSQAYAGNIIRADTKWITENIKQDVQMIKTSEGNLKNLVNLKIDIPNISTKTELELLKLQSDVSKFVVERLAKGKYGKAQGDEDKGAHIQINYINYGTKGKAQGDERPVREAEAEDGAHI